MGIDRQRRSLLRPLFLLAGVLATLAPVQAQEKAKKKKPSATRPGIAAAAKKPAALKPPLPPGQIVEARKIGARLIERYQKKALVLSRPYREGLQLKQIAAIGYCKAPNGKPVALTLPLLRTLDHLAARASRKRPLVLLSLYRPLLPTRPGEPHGRGQAIDIGAYGGYRIESSRPQECVNGVITLVKALPPRSYRLGLPRPHASNPIPLLPPPRRVANWPFFPPPEPETLDLLGIRVVAPRMVNGRFVRNRKGGLRPAVRRWENERYAAFSDLGSARVKRIFRAAARRGVNIHSLFPDAPDHLHLDVKP